MMIFRTGHARVCAVSLFLAIVATVAVERRVAELDFNDNYGCFLENNDSVDGDEVLGRLITVNDVVLPEVPRDTGAVVWVVPADEPPSISAPEHPAPGPRAPPTHSPTV